VSGPTNEDRADRAARAIATYGQDQSHEENLADLLADLQHLCQREGTNFARALRAAAMHHEAELAERDEPCPEHRRPRSTCPHYCGYALP
jgi:hypothetical protein